MADQTFTAGQVLTAAQMTTLQANSGLSYITQATVAPGSTTLSIDNCFTSAYQNYVIVYNITGYAAGPLYMKFRFSGSDDSAANYAFSRNYFRWDGGSTGADGNMTATSFTVGYCGASVSTIENTVNIYNPNVAERTSYNCNLVEVGSTTANSFNMIANGQKQTVTAYTGFSLIRFSTNTFGGTAYVYGYRKA